MVASPFSGGTFFIDPKRWGAFPNPSFPVLLDQDASFPGIWTVPEKTNEESYPAVDLPNCE